MSHPQHSKTSTDSITSSNHEESHEDPISIQNHVVEPQCQNTQTAKQNLNKHDDTIDESNVTRQTTNTSLGKKLGDSHNNQLSPAKVRLVLCAMSMSLMFAFIDQNGISVVLPYIADDLNAQLTISWAGTSQLIANCCFQLLCGRFADIFGRKNVLVFMILMLGLFDLACGLAKTDVQFFIFRALCGIAGGSIMSLVMVVMSDHVSLEERGKYQGYLTAFIGIGNGVGPLLASAFVQHNTWRHYYYTLFATIVSSSSIIIIFLPNSKSPISMKEKLKNIDYLGWLFGAVGLILILIPINGGGLTFKWNEPKVIIMFVIGGVSFICFLCIEMWVAKLPLVPFRVFKSTSLAILFAQSFCSGVAFYPLFYYYAYYFEVVRNEPVLKTACFFLCVIGPHSLISALAGRFVSMTKHYNPTLWTGFALWTLALSLLAGVLKKDTNLVGVAFIMVVNGLGQGMTFQNTLVAALAHSRTQDRSVVISTRNVLRSFGGSFGLAFSALIFSTTFTKSLQNDSFINQPDNSSLKSYLEGHVYSKINYSEISLTHEQHEYIRDLYMKCVKDIYTFWAPIVGFCFICALFIKDRGLISKGDQKEQKSQDDQDDQKDQKDVKDQRIKDEEEAIGNGENKNKNLDPSEKK